MSPYPIIASITDAAPAPAATPSDANIGTAPTAIMHAASRSLFGVRSPTKLAASAPPTPPTPVPIPIHTPARATLTPWYRVSIAGRNVEKAYMAKFIAAPEAAIHQNPADA